MIKVAADQKAVQRKKDKEKNMQKNYEATRNCFARSLKKTCQCSQSKRKINEHQTEKELLLTYVLLYLYSDDMSLTYVANNHVRSVYMYCAGVELTYTAVQNYNVFLFSILVNQTESHLSIELMFRFQIALKKL